MDSILSFDRSKEENYYDILGCDQSSSVDQMMAEYKNRALALHPDKNKNVDTVHDFRLLQEAKETLTNATSKANYDKWLRSGVTVPYRRWKNMDKGACFHWSTPPKPERMLPQNETGDISPSHQETGGAYHSPSHQETEGAYHPPFHQEHGGAKQRVLRQKTGDSGQGGWRTDSSDLIKKFRNYEI